MATYKNDIILIAGSGDFAFEAANFLTKKEKLNHIILLSKNSEISKRYKKVVSYFDIRDIEKLIKFIKKRQIIKVLIIGYVHLPPIKEIKLSLSSKLILSKDFFLNDINMYKSDFIIEKKYPITLSIVVPIFLIKSKRYLYS